MNAFLSILLIIALILLFVLLSRTGDLLEQLQKLNHKFILLKDELASLKQSFGTTPPKEVEEKRETSFVAPLPTIVPPAPIPPPEPIQLKEEVFSSEEYETPAPTPVGWRIPTPPVAAESIPQPVLVKQKETPSFFTTFLDKNPDLEKFIGENLINKIGIAVLVLGIGFFVKFAIDQEWINELGRVFIGFLSGGILLGFAHYTRTNFKAFSSVLAGGGIAIFYLTIAIAFHEYRIFDQPTAFALMIAITTFAVVLSIVYDRKELAVLAIIGGFSSPMLVSTGAGNYSVLFSYITLLNLGMLVLSYFKRWSIVNIVCFAFTILLMGTWTTKTYMEDADAFPYLGGLLFATLFYFIFFLMNVINNLRDSKKFVAVELSLLIVNTFFYYSIGMFMLKGIHDGLYQGLFTALIAVFNFIFAYLLFKSKKADRTLVYLLIGLVLSFVTLSAPIQLKGNFITLFWAAEALLLLWLSQKSSIILFKASSIIISVLMVISLTMDWDAVYGGYDQLIPVVFNKGFATGLVACLSLSGILLLLKKEQELFYLVVPTALYSRIIGIALIVIAYFTGFLEVAYQADTLISKSNPDFYDWGTPILYTGCYNLAFVAILTSFIRIRKLNNLYPLALGGGVLISIVYVAYYSYVITTVRDSYLFGEIDSFHYWFHYVNVALLIFITMNIVYFFNIKTTKNSKLYNSFLWFSCFVAVFVAGKELEHAMIIIGFKGVDSIYFLKNIHTKVGLPILWGICSLTFMLLGMKLEMKMLRIIALTLFGIALLKLFIVDLKEMSEGGKIAAFISLGVLLLIISFMYQKLKKLLTEE